MLNFEELTDARRILQTFCLLHEPSLLALRSGVSFKLLPSDEELGSDKVRHLTTTATCLSSLLECPARFRTSEFKQALELKSDFAKKALARKFKGWTSEGSAGVYCRCRALPMVINSSVNFDRRIKGHINEILAQLRKEPGRFGIGEAGSALPKDQWYPPNAFHTYWTLEIFGLLERKFPAEYRQFSEAQNLGLKHIRQGMLLWGRQQLGSQLGLHSALPPSSMLDSDQLAWALAIFLRFDAGLTVNLENRDLVGQAFKCLFSTQTDGTWRHYKPLFHYKDVGNAYCYPFETFSVLLQSALQEKPEAEMIREALKPYCKNLLDLWGYAESTKMPLGLENKEIGWCSGHRTNVTEPESWASASVFSYAQALRRLVGIWCREEALKSFSKPKKKLTPEEAEQEISSRGKTWGTRKKPVSEQLWAMFINPVRSHDCADKLEPDSQPIEKKHARSAILFGPPGTSKTSLVRALADAIEWKYVEIHASHFVAEGLTQVQKTADRIFKQILELDHTVVLFDEIDELVRERDIEKDAFGRFLTTSMLPKLAELWDARKILYFVATNHINYFDSAIIRSHRFDALILVSPPSFSAKIEELERLLASKYHLPGRRFATKQREIEIKLMALRRKAEALGKNEAEERVVREQRLAPEFALAKLALLRWDELDELAYRLSAVLKSRSSRSRTIPSQALEVALGKVADSEWRKNKSYFDFLRDTHSERRDYEMVSTPGRVKIRRPTAVP
jgi:ATPase family associated with various cellular activities (AAA)